MFLRYVHPCDKKHVRNRLHDEGHARLGGLRFVSACRLQSGNNKSAIAGVTMVTRVELVTSVFSWIERPA